MSFHNDHFERFAMKAEETSQSSAPLAGVDIDAVSEALSLSREQGREYAVVMQDEGWANLDFAGGTPRLRLTRKGREAIAQMRWPRWYRWLYKNLGPVNLLIGIVALAIGAAALLVALLK